MATAERAYDRGTRTGQRWLRMLGQELRTARLTLGLSQREVAKSARISRTSYGNIERAELTTLSLLVAARIAALLGLDLYTAMYPGARGLRDQASANLIKRIMGAVGQPLRARTEVVLPQKGDARELRSWDVLARGHGERTAFEVDSRLYDAQAQTRRWNLKRRDDPVDHFVLVVADTRSNRRVLDENPELFADLPRLRTANVLKALNAGQHPPTGLILLSASAEPAENKPAGEAD
jgi:transcriptional regulator with XRE-family HTH domain